MSEARKWATVEVVLLLFFRSSSRSVRLLVFRRAIPPAHPLGHMMTKCESAAAYCCGIRHPIIFASFCARHFVTAASSAGHALDVGHQQWPIIIAVVGRRLMTVAILMTRFVQKAAASVFDAAVVRVPVGTRKLIDSRILDGVAPDDCHTV